MTPEPSEYHRAIAARNRGAILDAAAGLFLEIGYDRTSLARVAQSAGVSRATLFKQFPSKAELFEATVLAAGKAPDTPPVDPPGDDSLSGLIHLGRAYAEVLVRPQMLGLMRTIIAESPRFPELRERTFDFGTLPVLQSLRRYLRQVSTARSGDTDDSEVAATQFLGMIASAIFWPRLVHGTWSITEEETLRAIDEAAQTIVARYATAEHQER
ncbi:TetR/AcrR family transcriptional regulator [Microbacterium yannicii]|uniref:TetR/AcrR family transcriptional regulator n=1 Tax=Microbacterium yannicii TaxID=671622 RepID=UPI0002E127EB|nr:TetR/AcrR family transcriptional regulator [Microbacterium yannicii]